MDRISIGESRLNDEIMRKHRRESLSISLDFRSPISLRSPLTPKSPRFQSKHQEKIDNDDIGEIIDQNLVLINKMDRK